MHIIRFGGRGGLTFEVDNIIHMGPNGDDSNDGLTENTAVRTLPRAKQLITKNDALHIMEGDWDCDGFTNPQSGPGVGLFDGSGYGFDVKLVFGHKEKSIITQNRSGRDVRIFMQPKNGIYTHFTIRTRGMGSYGCIFSGSGNTKFYVHNLNFIGSHGDICDSYSNVYFSNCCFNWNDTVQYYVDSNAYGVNNVYSTNSRAANNRFLKNYCKQVAPGSITDFYNPPLSFENAGDPTILNPDGTRSDVGLLGGPYSWLLDVVIDPKDSITLVNDTQSIKTDRGGVGRLYNLFCLISFIIIYITLFIYKKKGVV